MKRTALLLMLLTGAASAQQIPNGMILLDANGQGHASEATVDAVTRAVTVLSLTHRTYDYLTFECDSKDSCRALAQDTIRLYPHTAQELVIVGGTEPAAAPKVEPKPAEPAPKPVPSNTPGLAPAKLLYAPAPESAADEGYNYDGTVVVRCIVGIDGRPYDIHVTKGLYMDLDMKATDAVARYHFAPAQLNGKGVPTEVAVRVRFVITGHKN